MVNSYDLSKSSCKIIATKIRESVFKPSSNLKTTIFICGADIHKKETLRFKIAKFLTSFPYSSSYDLIYPEDIFEELLYSSNSTDLLSLENLLADSVDVVVIIPESPGSFAELGAFANNEKLRNKIICVIDEKFKKDKSFINKGPVKLVRNVNKDGIVYINPSEIEKSLKDVFDFLFVQSKEIQKIVTVIKKLKKQNIRVKNKLTLLQLDRFLLPTIYLLEPVTKNTLIEIIANAIEEEKNSYSSTITALAMLTKKRYVELNGNEYKLTQLGIEEFLNFSKNSRIKTQSHTIAIDELRLEILNLKYRGKKLKV